MPLDDVPGVSLQEAGRAVLLYWGGAFVVPMTCCVALAVFAVMAGPRAPKREAAISATH
ncbi:hypothetical protein M0208_08540 [Sphingomonas sp. SUN019]|uniref:hypothetical protein n=1 Tax=Sphingomonas sp. SUN019 TaxID=2937788 RepID=UPI002164D875|nr:hypothetical protein [Sphingomonas sp. SUN019]UVO50561.1 hypothetical protein M0208_08540 [Sphingomonas sp. SUN019]